jgi:hypothetical protein
MTTTDNGSGATGQAAGAGDAAAAAAATAAAQGQTGQTGADRADAIQNGSGTFEVPADVIEWGKSKGYKPEQMAKVFAENPDMYAMANSYRNAEKLLGGEKLVMPKDATDQAGWDMLYNKLGRPEKPEGYKIPLPEGSAGGELEQWAKQTFFKNGLTQTQAEGVGKEWIAIMNATIARDEAESAKAAATQRGALEKEWGADFKANEEVARRATTQLGKMVGMDGLDLDQMEKAFGLGKSMKMMEQIGRILKVDSDTYEGANNLDRGASVKSVEAARTEKETLFKDPAFVEKYNKNDTAARAKIASLNGIISAANPTYSGQ